MLVLEDAFFRCMLFVRWVNHTYRQRFQRQQQRRRSVYSKILQLLSTATNTLLKSIFLQYLEEELLTIGKPNTNIVQA
jgi:hypothetical protein